MIIPIFFAGGRATRRWEQPWSLRFLCDIYRAWLFLCAELVCWRDNRQLQQFKEEGNEIKFLFWLGSPIATCMPSSALHAVFSGSRVLDSRFPYFNGCHILAGFQITDAQDPTSKNFLGAGSELTSRLGELPSLCLLIILLMPFRKSIGYECLWIDYW